MCSILSYLFALHRSLVVGLSRQLPSDFAFARRAKNERAQKQFKFKFRFCSLPRVQMLQHLLLSPTTSSTNAGRRQRDLPGRYCEVEREVSRGSGSDEEQRRTYESPSVTVTRDTFPLTGDETICSIFMALRTQILEGGEPSQLRIDACSGAEELTGHQP